jgi:hypothetical protein
VGDKNKENLLENLENIFKDSSFFGEIYWPLKWKKFDKVNLKFSYWDPKLIKSSQKLQLQFRLSMGSYDLKF